jgi:hypothetical protein
MFIWKGRGLVLLLLVAAIVYGAGKYGPVAMANGLLLSAVIVYFLRDDESHVYYFRVKFWPPLLVVLAALVYMGK